MEEKRLPVYESPKVVTYTDEELLEELGPAQTGYVCGDSVIQWVGWVKRQRPHQQKCLKGLMGSLRLTHPTQLIKNILTFLAKNVTPVPSPIQVEDKRGLPMAGDKLPALRFPTHSGSWLVKVIFKRLVNIVSQPLFIG